MLAAAVSSAWALAGGTTGRGSRVKTMRVTTNYLDLSGTNESPQPGNFIVDSGRQFISQNVVVGVSVLTNTRYGTSGVVTQVTQTKINAPVLFSPGDFYTVTLASPWTLQNSDGPVITVECRVCGFSYPEKDMNDEVCKWCQDRPWPT